MNVTIEEKIRKLRTEIDIAEYNLKSNFNDFELQDLLPEIDIFSNDVDNHMSRNPLTSNTFLASVSRLLFADSQLINQLIKYTRIFSSGLKIFRS